MKKLAYTYIAFSIIAMVIILETTVLLTHEPIMIVTVYTPTVILILYAFATSLIVKESKIGIKRKVAINTLVLFGVLIINLAALLYYGNIIGF